MTYFLLLLGQGHEFAPTPMHRSLGGRLGSPFGAGLEENKTGHKLWLQVHFQEGKPIERKSLMNRLAFSFSLPAKSHTPVFSRRSRRAIRDEEMTFTTTVLSGWEERVVFFLSSVRIRSRLLWYRCFTKTGMV